MDPRIWIRAKMSLNRNTAAATNLEESARSVGLCDGFLREWDPADGLRVAGPLGHLAEGERCPTLLHLLLLLVPHNLNQVKKLLIQISEAYEALLRPYFAPIDPVP
jgi:hypothetical protein